MEECSMKNLSRIEEWLKRAKSNTVVGKIWCKSLLTFYVTDGIIRIGTNNKAKGISLQFHRLIGMVK